MSRRPSRTTEARLALVGDMAPPPDEPPDDPPDEPPHGEDSFGALVASHREHLRKKAHQLCGNPDTAKDLAQETIARALKRRTQFEPGTHLETWLVKILTNLFLDWIKHKKVERNAEPDLMVLMPVACDHEFEQMLATIRDAELRAAVESLEPDLRAVVELCYLRQMRYREASDQLGVPAGTVATRLMRARERLREILTTTNRKAVKP